LTGICSYKFGKCRVGEGIDGFSRFAKMTDNKNLCLTNKPDKYFLKINITEDTMALPC
jgi:hypothetical protein